MSVTEVEEIMVKWKEFWREILAETWRKNGLCGLKWHGGREGEAV